MQISECGAHNLDDSSQEKCSHGTPGFPLAIYDEDLKSTPVPLHWHVETEFITMESGEGIFSCNGKEIRLKEGQGIFFNSGSLHGCRPLEDQSCRIRCIVMHPRFIAGETDNALWEKYILPVLRQTDFAFCPLKQEEDWQNRCISLIRQAWNDIYQEEEGFEFFSRNRLSKLWLLLFQNRKQSNGVASALQSKNLTRVKQMLDYLEKNFAEEIWTEDIAKAAGISRSECQRCFKNVVAKTPNQYLTELRLQKACDYLANTDLPVSRIAELCGFMDNSYFGKLFRKEKKITPLQYRMRKTENETKG